MEKHPTFAASTAGKNSYQSPAIPNLMKISEVAAAGKIYQQKPKDEIHPHDGVRLRPGITADLPAPGHEVGKWLDVGSGFRDSHVFTPDALPHASGPSERRGKL
jgi:hypothetical protein